MGQQGLFGKEWSRKELNKGFLIENGESKGHVSIRKELIWGRNAFFGTELGQDLY